MKIKKFRIQNFKSINDSGYCAFASDLTILVGKNESGKTATLEALKFFNKDILRVSENALPLDDHPKEPLVEVNFQLSLDEFESVKTASGAQVSEGAFDYVNMPIMYRVC